MVPVGEAAAVGPGSREWTEAVNGAALRVEQIGAGDETVVFSPAFFTDRGMFRPTMAELSGSHRCVAYDHRGQGDSGLGAAESPWHGLGVEAMYADAVALLDGLGIGSCHWVGASLGGFVGIRLAARQPDRVRSLVLIGPVVEPSARSLLLKIDLGGLALSAGRALGPLGVAVRDRLTERMMAAMLGPAFMADPARAGERDRWRRVFRAQVAPERAAEIRAMYRHPGNPPALLHRVGTPTLVMVGEDEPGGTGGAQRVQAAIPDARLAVIPAAGHMVLVEEPQAGTAAIAGFIRGDGP